MSNEQHQGSESHESSVEVDGSIAGLYQAWTALDRGWQAICFSSVLVLAVGVGLPIPW